MATNTYFSNYTQTSEQDLIEDLVIEAIQIKGLDVKYIPRNTVSENTLFGEITESTFILSQEIEMYPETVERYDGDGAMFGNFGYEINDTMSLAVSKSRFAELFTQARPFEGDLIYLPVTNALFEIKFVDHEDPFFQKGKNYVYKLKVELYEFNNETFDTTDVEIDDLLTSLTTDTPDTDVPSDYGDNDTLEVIGDNESYFDPNNPFGV